MKNILFILLFCFLMTGCATTPDHYTDPLASFGDRRITEHFSELVLGVILSESFYNASHHLEDQHALAKSLSFVPFSKTYIKDTEPQYIIDCVNSELVKRFKKVVPLRDIGDAHSSEIDLYVLLDMNISLGSYSGTTTTVILSGMFMDMSDRIIEKVDGKGSSKVPFPALRANVREAAARSIFSFTADLDHSVNMERFATDFSGPTYGKRMVDLPTLDIPPVNIAVADLFIENASSSSVKALTDQLRGTLVEIKYFHVLSRDDMQKILDEQNLQFSSASNDVQQLVKLGRMLPAQKIIGGNVGKVGGTYSLTLRLVDIETGRIEYMVNEIIEAEEDELIPLVQHAGKILAKKYAHGANER